MYGSQAGVDCNQRFSQLVSIFSLFTASLIALRGSSLRNPLAPRVLLNRTLVKVILAVVKQPKQLQRKRRKKFTRIASTSTSVFFLVWFTFIKQLLLLLLLLACAKL